MGRRGEHLRNRPCGDVVARFFALTERRGECLEWVGAKTPGGYGSFSLPSPTGARRWVVVMAHRMAVYLSGRNIPPGMMACHSCDNRACVRADHLFIGTAADNTMDAYRKGRLHKHMQPGEKNGSARLTAADVASIRRSSTGTRGECAAMSRKYGVGRTTIASVLSGRTWGEVVEES